MKRFIMVMGSSLLLLFPITAQISIGFSGSMLFAGVFGYSLLEEIDGTPVDTYTGYGLEDINTIRFCASVDLKYLWIEAGISTAGPMMGGDIYGGDEADIKEYALFFSGNLLLPFYRGRFSFFPIVGIEFSRLISLTIDGNNVLETAPDEMISIFNSRFTLKAGVGFDWEISDRIKLRTVGFLGDMSVNPDGYLDGFIPLFYGPGFSDFSVMNSATTYIISTSVFYKFASKK